MDNYKPNSHKSKTIDVSEKKVEKVIVGNAKQKKKSEIRKFTDVFISEDIDNVKSYIIADVLVPSIKDALYDVVTTSVKMMLFGDKGKPSSKTSGSKVSYRSYYDNDRKRDTSYNNSSRNGFEYDDIIFETRNDAEAVLNGMFDILERYEIVTVADLYDLANITNKNYMINKYGWTNLSNAEPIRVRDGYAIKLPKPRPI